MFASLAIALAVIVVLLGIVALARRGLPPGTRRNVLSVSLVLLGFAAAFVVCFGGGFLVHRLRAEAQAQAAVHRPDERAGDARPRWPEFVRDGRLVTAS